MPPRFAGVMLASCFVVALLWTPPVFAAAPSKKIDHSRALAGEFSLKSAPPFEITPEQKQKGEEIIREMKRGYGGTIVTSPAPDPAIDTPAFLASYLREFSGLDKKKGIHTYDYRFERILGRVSETPAMLDDPRLDWDLWRAFLLYESFWDGALYFEEKNGKESSWSALDSAKDLLWAYLEQHGEKIVHNPDRLRWWVDHLAAGLEQPGGRPMRRWFLLQLCAFADPTEQPPPLEFLTPGGPEDMRLPAGDDPFLIVDDAATPPPFPEALEAITRPLKLALTVWGIAPADQPPTRKVEAYLEQVRYPAFRCFIIGQESWSEPDVNTEEWTVRFSRSVGQRSRHSYAIFPNPNRTDGVFFFAFRQRLFVWPKAKMDSGVLQLLHTAGLIDDARWQQFQSAGILKLELTLTMKSD